MTTARYWTWSELRDGDATDPRALMEDLRSAWAAAVRKRLDGSQTPGLTLSGGLDSRAILAEATRQGRTMRALTYGVPHSDDVTIAARAARAAGAPCELYPLYADGWLERRTNRILETDGLMDLVDLMHTEPFDRMPASFDVYLSGYVGDAVAGSTLFFVDRPEDLLASMPYYGGTLALSHSDALAKAEEIIASTPGPPRFAPYENKLPQSTNRITAAARPFATVRRPFVDYRFFETSQRIAPAWRANQAWREQWLVSTYPELFARIPNQQTGVPPRSSRVRWQMTRAARFGWRRLLRTARAAGLPVIVPERSYHPDNLHWTKPAARAAIEGTILRTGSLSCDLFGRDRVRATLREFFDAGAAPVQVIGALYVFEHYHQALGACLADARRQIKTHAC
jgi:asparagine synthase (glutamine-hydrolysing)